MRNELREDEKQGGERNEFRVSSKGEDERGVQGWWVGVLGSLFNTREMEVKWEDFTPAGAHGWESGMLNIEGVL